MSEADAEHDRVVIIVYLANTICTSVAINKQLSDDKSALVYTFYWSSDGKL